MPISDLAGLSEPLKRLIEVISNGIGNIYQPYLIRKTADAKAYEIRTISEALGERQQALPNSEYTDGKIKLSLINKVSIDSPSLLDRTAARIEYQNQRQQQNIEAVCASAATELDNEQSVPETKPDSEWVSRFINIASEISTETVQDLWGRILAGEIKKPGSFSLRTLEVLRNLSSKEAESFAKLGNYCLRIDSKVIFIDPNAYIFTKANGLTFTDILALKDAGIVSANEAGFSFEPCPAGVFQQWLYGPLILFMEREKDTPRLQRNVGILTRVGTELLSLLKITPDMDYVSLLKQQFTSDGVSFAWAVVLQNSGDQIHHTGKTYL